MDKVAQIIGMAGVEFDAELLAYEAQEKGHFVSIIFPDVRTYNEWWKTANYIKRCYDRELAVDHLIPYEGDHDPVKRIAAQLYAHMRQSGGDL